jgi:hypothetical protein
MKLPNAERAVVDIRKLRDYCLNPTSPRGQTKARVFSAALGLGSADAQGIAHPGNAMNLDNVIRWILSWKPTPERPGFEVVGSRKNEVFPRLTTCYVLLQRRAL